MTRRLLLVFLTVLAVTVSLTAPAGAAPQAAATETTESRTAQTTESRTTTGTGTEVVRATVRRAKPAGADGARVAAASLTRAEEAFHRVAHWKDRVANVVTCHDDQFAWDDTGFVVSHYGFCQNFTIELEHEVETCNIRTIFGCIWRGRDLELGHAVFDVTVIGSGWDATMLRDDEYVEPRFNQMRFVTVYHNFREVRLEAPAFLMKLDITCDALGAALCQRHPIDAGKEKTLAEWQRDGGQFIRYLHEPDVGTGPDRLNHFDFNYKFEFKAGTGSDTLDLVGNSYRCDAATYVKGGRGCVFHDMESVFDRLNLDPSANYWEEALHIAEAMFHPDRTFPQPPDGETKDVPGNLLAEAPRPLTRTVDDSIRRANNAQAVSTCVNVWGAGYAAGGRFECDEYPFGSTFQGASRAEPPWNYSARRITASHNSSGGGVLGNWYTDQRIVEGDGFYVWLNGIGTGGGGGGGPLPITNGPPKVSAGPDVAGPEGSAIRLFGSASDVQETPTVSWSYTAGADVDEGATCSFGNAASAGTTITCTDDGTYEVTLTASDGVNSPVRDSATVRVSNVAPTITLDGPDTWQVFRAGTSVPLTASFTDPGANDTHTCTVDWDEGGEPQAYAATGRSCDQAHVFEHAGMYTIALTVRDDDGGTDEVRTMVVVYDPDGSAVNAVGSIDSPAGALFTDPDAAGRARFHLNARYHGEDDTAPAGKASGSLPGTDFDFEAGSLAWLVVTRDGKVASRGTGTIEGKPGTYGFVFYGYQGCHGNQGGCQPGPDRFRAVVWPLAGNPHPGVVATYDNRATAVFDVDMAEPQQLETGTVSIHPPPS